jgi:hypothetical protein
MPRNASTSSTSVIEEAVRTAISRSWKRIDRSIQRAVDAQVAQELAKTKGLRRGTVRSGRGMRAGEITRWISDNRARRVPNFVIEMTGLDTKKKIVAKYGPNAAFEKGKPLPPVKLAAAKPQEPQAKPVREEKTRPPVIRKAAAAHK